jgi:hypothetical protein
VERDLADFAAFGVTAEKLDEFRDYIDDFEELVPDGSILADVQHATQQKNLIREQLLESVRNLSLRVELKWGTDSSNYRRLNLSTLTRLSDAELLFAARTVHTRTTDWVTDLTDLGLTLELLNSYNNIIQNFELSLIELSDITADRDIKRVERITLGNQLYQLVLHYTSIGKRIYERTNIAKYNEYIIYTPSAGSLVAPTDLAYHIPTKILSWTQVLNATSYQAEFSNNGSTWETFYSGNSTSIQYPNSIEQVVYFRVKARNDNGFGPLSQIEVHFDNTLATPHNLTYHYTDSTITWDAVSNANFYELVYRQANTSNDWINLYNGPNTETQFLFPDGSWEMKIRATNAEQGSSWSPIRIVTLPLAGDSSNNG